MNAHFVAYGILVLIILYFVNNLLMAKKKGPVSDAPAPAGTWTVYGTNGCGWTRKQLDVMEQKNIPHKFIDCDSNDCKGASAFPTLVDPQGNKTVGFNSLE